MPNYDPPIGVPRATLRIMFTITEAANQFNQVGWHPKIRNTVWPEENRGERKRRRMVELDEQTESFSNHSNISSFIFLIGGIFLKLI